MDITQHWKQIPICGDCALYLEAGKKFIEKYLKFKEFGLNYYIVPNFLFDSKEGFSRLYSTLRRFEGSDKYSDNVTLERRLNRLTSDLNDIIEFKFLFFQIDLQEFKILSYVESVLPSWMNEIFNSQRDIMDLYIFSEDNLKNVISKDAVGNLVGVINSKEKYHPVSVDNWYLGILREFFSNYYFKYYLENVCAVLTNKPLDFNFLLLRFIDKIRENWRNNSEYLVKLNTLKTLSLILLFSKLNLLNNGGNMGLNLQKEDFNEELLMDEIINSPDKKASFLLGVLTRRLTYVQYKKLKSAQFTCDGDSDKDEDNAYNKLKSAPFTNKLWGLSLDKKRIQKLYPMVLNKLREYDKDYQYSELKENISINLLKAENNWELTRDETSYYFVLGYTLSFEINKKEELLDDAKGENI